MGQDPNQPYPGQYGQPGGVPPQQGGYQGGYQPPNAGYQQPAPGYQQPNTGYQYQQPYGQQGPLYNTAHPNGATSMNMDPNTAAGLSYLAGWITGLIFFLVEKQNRFVRFHAMQSLLTFASITVLYIVVNILFVIPFINLIACFLWPVLWIATLALWIILMIQGFQGKYFKLPIIGDYAERYANSGTPRM